MRIRNLESRIKLFFSLCLSITALFLPLAAHAAESTPSADTKIKLEQLKKEIASKAAGLKKEVSNKLQNKAFVGVIRQVTSSSITLVMGETSKLISYNQDTVLMQVKKKKTAPRKEDYIAALGEVDDTGLLHAKKIILLPEPTKKLQKIYVWGQIISISDNLYTILGRDQKGEAFFVSGDTKIKGHLKLSEIVILSGERGKNDIIDAGFVYVMPQGAAIKPKVATVSAKVATSSAKKK